MSYGIALMVTGIYQRFAGVSRLPVISTLQRKVYGIGMRNMVYYAQAKRPGAASTARTVAYTRIRSSAMSSIDRLPLDYKVPAPQPDPTKVCSRCEKTLPSSDFGPNSGNRDGLARYCRECASKRSKEYNATGKWHGRHLERTYGISKAEYESILASQGGCCAICKIPPTNRRFHVDHDHDTNVVRGILCNGCNTALGGMRDNPAILRAGADYLEKHGK